MGGHQTNSSKQILLQEIIYTVQTQFSDKLPNGISLGWDRERFYQEIQLLFLPKHEVINQSDFNYSYCNSYDILLFKGTRKSKIILTVKISYITNAFILYTVEYSDNNNLVAIDGDHIYDKEVERVRHFFMRKNFKEIESSELDIIVPGVSLELAEVATLEKCLFDDY